MHAVLDYFYEYEARSDLRAAGQAMQRKRLSEVTSAHFGFSYKANGIGIKKSKVLHRRSSSLMPQKQATQGMT